MRAGRNGRDVFRVIDICGEDGGLGALDEFLGSSSSLDRTKGEFLFEETSAG